MTPQQTARSVIPVVLLVVGLGMYVSSNVPAPGSLGATVAAAAPSQQDPRVAAIQTVIQTANKEQAQALESGDTSVMSTRPQRPTMPLSIPMGALFAHLLHTPRQSIGATRAERSTSS